MGRCPVYLSADDFERLAEASGISLTNDGVSALGEIAELISQLILQEAEAIRSNNPIDMRTIIASANKLGIYTEIDRAKESVSKVALGS